MAERLLAHAVQQSEQDGRWIYEWNTGEVGKLTFPEGFAFEPRTSTPVFTTSRHDSGNGTAAAGFAIDT